MKRKQLPIGATYGRLTVIDNFVANRSGRPRMICRCRCTCGNTIEALANSLQIGNTNSCGCYMRDRSRAKATHGHTRDGKFTPAYLAWANMRLRCQSPKSKSFRNYGARGITVCDRWQKFENFLADMGEPPDGYELDRIDVNGNYDPINCRWATILEQANNKRSNRFIEAGGERKTLAEWARTANLPYMKLYYRLDIGWSMADALFQPVVSGRA